MFLDTVRYCRDDVAIKRLKYIMSNIDDSIVDRYIERGGQYTLFFNIRAGVTLLLFKKRDDKEWLALFKTNYTKRQYLYCILAARVVCKNVHIIVNDVDDTSIMDEARLLNAAGYKFKMVTIERFDAYSKGDDDILSLRKNIGSFVIESDNRVPVSIIRKKMILK